MQAYTGFIYGGPGWPRRLHAGLAAKLAAANLPSIEAAIGRDAVVEASADPRTPAGC